MKQLFALFFLIFLTLQSTVYSDTSSAVFSKYINPVFIETGSFMGHGIQKAIDAGFPEIYSIELAPHHHEYCLKRFQACPNVHLIQGDSGAVLKELMATINQRATFWLDGHFSAGVNSAMGKNRNPILDELAIIASHPIKNHTILIDDVRLFGTADFDYITIKTLIKIIMSINPKYTIRFEDGYIPNDVLVAEVL